SLPPQFLALGPGPEFDRIRDIMGQLGEGAAALGDDCGLFEQGGEFVALSTDVSVEGVHFRREWITSEEVGWRAAAAALSDLAADGAAPIGLLCAITMPARAPETELLSVMAGVSAAAKAVGASILGGDLASGPAWSVAVTVVGRTRAPVTRGGAEHGDRLWVTGTLGGARAALEAWLQNRVPLPGARTRFACPEPRIAAGIWLAEHGAKAMIDLSDGLAGDVWHLAAASQLSIEIDLGSLPVAAEAQDEARKLGVSPGQFAAEGGEDYELLTALPAGFGAADAFRRECGIPLTPIGEAVSGSGVRFLLSGHPIELHGFNHFG
ncbi:MAG TPA: thiamine-phosphate kinase, partial [Gemmatimonadales bacterium]|nr:thiamine-phosphate kinase [Gemmatimonadales bacterium]